MVAPREMGFLEELLWEKGFVAVAGADEAGRGALAGPLVAAAVLLNPDARLTGVRDSKLLSPVRREELVGVIEKEALAVSVARVEPEEVDELGVGRANLKALGEALRPLVERAEFILVDGFAPGGLSRPCLGVKKGDRVSRAVAAASVLAKVARDSIMLELDLEHPGYGFARNKGYGTGQHLEALRRLGPSPVHRRSFLEGIWRDS